MRPKPKLHDFDMSDLRRTMMSFHIEFKELPTLRKLKQVSTEKIDFPGCNFAYHFKRIWL